MDLSDASSRYDAFYVPAFTVKVDGRALTYEVPLAVNQVEIDKTLGGAAHFGFTIVNAFDQEKGEFVTATGQPAFDLLRFGAKVEIAVGYGDHRKLTPVLFGTITNLSTGFSEGGTPELSVSGYDNMFPLTLGKRSKSWKEVKDSDVVHLIAQGYGLSTDIVSTDETHEQIEQNQEGDLDFITKLAKRNHYEFYMTEKDVLRFGPPRDTSNGLMALAWSKGLLSFKPEANLASQISRVRVLGWDPEAKKAIVGEAVAGEESGKEPSRSSAGEYIKKFAKKDVVLEVRQPVFTQAEAKERATAILSDHAKAFLTGEAECVGLPELMPDTNVSLTGLGKTFSKIYYIHAANHKVDGNGYRTRFKVKETSL
ncbi:phage late control D family protein [Microvirga splendida]|uniref:Phage late control D family protein n=1 Tax=Microvirga splendida TaxID=2795727 RepID=A0ABS0Y4H8_9HYPH|nr:phage late control D family protein [Microvirga splendida]MBJ6127192.1 phage late control D family protein [Microvirga splendida]